jgi:hypothetical protein
MWNERICWDYFYKTVYKRPETQFYREPTLYIIDSYGCHINWPINHARTLEQYNVFVKLIPKNLTSILQPLDVAVNRSFQADYEARYDEYIQEALMNPDLQTRQGNPKCPTPMMVSEWALEWINKCNQEDVAKAFKVLYFFT